jgi:hypothetical protein
MFYARIFDRRSGVLLGHLADLTPGGILLIGPEPLPAGQEYLLQLELPDGFDFPGPHLNFSARSIWSQPDLDPALHAAGFALQGVGPAELAIIERIIAAYGLAQDRGG